MKRSEFVITAVVFVTATFYPLANIWFEKNYVDSKFEKPAMSRMNLTGRYDKELLSHRLIEFDRNNGLASAEKSALAFGNTQVWLNEVRKNCSPDLNNSHFLMCANQLLGKHFYYKPAQAVTDGWAAHYSDCDLNVYLLMDAMHIAGKNSDIVYAPHHAFISCVNETTHEHEYLETTAGHNAGGFADLQQDFYLKTMSHFYYTPQSLTFAESLYPALVIDRITDEKTRHKFLVSLRATFPDNPIVQDAWYEQKKPITRDDARILVSLIMTDITSVSKRVLLADYLNSHQQKDKAQWFLSQIPADNCNDACLKLKSQTSLFYRFTRWSLQKLMNMGLSISPGEFMVIVSEALLYDLFLLLAFGTYLANKRWTLIIRKREDIPVPPPTNEPAG
ncbi:hypothetical protein JMT66_23445 (plasmid) [Kosakonia cowanii]|uniref:hypothetical protein n=1 Tax=Kosakonia cowanii TaxID=208223 RepID=UPI001E4F5975|nr:hypothetical protein [Kosakonia cowanii]UGS48634.1 hypothetical protein JMT66_23445 [Kosakonia cowanii]